MPKSISPKILFTSTIHMPACGNTFIDPENDPMSKSCKLRPTPNANNKIKPSNLLPNVVTMLSNKISPGDNQGDATVPLAMPNKNAEAIEPPPFCVPDCRNARGTYMS